ncbi:ras guanine nucleotide exchange factor domain-containing protein [Irpex rosettiformis]|uniref:Ras guanine nucleotide exchange factor domain-containing protein n=1 Tax=Irpex rosettiformis TaxID=378272 RepID=A0ACB8TYM5_9APHY|nr:ras guanine nucleotide exchange factor domain-containing protein [Irpex rosettiformis]
MKVSRSPPTQSSMARAKPFQSPSSTSLGISIRASTTVLGEYVNPLAVSNEPRRNKLSGGAINPLTHPFPRPKPQPVQEADLVDFDPIPCIDSVSRTFTKKFDLEPIESYAIAQKACSKAWHDRDTSLALSGSEKFIAASKALRELILTISMPGSMGMHAQRAINHVESWEGMLESHCSKIHLPMSEESRSTHWIFGFYLVTRIRDCNNDLVHIIGLPCRLDHPLLSKLIRRIDIHEIEKPGIFSRLVERTLAQLPSLKDTKVKKDITKAEREVPEVSKYPAVAPTPPAGPDIPAPAPEYFDQCTDQSLTELNVDLRAASIAFHLTFRHHEATSTDLPIPVTGKDLSDESIITEANIPTLVRYLTDHFEDSSVATSQLLDAFFRFFRYITTPQRLLQLLTNRYLEKPPKHSSKNDRLRWHSDHVFTKLFIVRMIARWLECYYLHAEDKIILDWLSHFTRKYVVKDEDLPPSASKLITLQQLECDAGRKGVTYIPILERTIAEGKLRIKDYPETAFTKHLFSLKSLKDDKMISHADILLFHNEGGPEEIARTLTRLAAMRFQERVPSELIRWKRLSEGMWLKHGYIFANALAMWTSQVILEQKLPSNRAKAYEVMVEVAQICHDMRNFSSAFAIVAVLVNERVTRLRHTRKLVSEKHKKYMHQLEEFFKSDNNAAYNAEMRRPPAPAVPNPVVVSDQLSQLTADQGFHEKILKGRDEIGLIDFYTLRRLGRIVKDVERCFIPYEVPVHALVEDWVKSRLQPLEDRNIFDFNDEMDKLSHLREPEDHLR